MPISDNLLERLKSAIKPGDNTQDDGAAYMRTQGTVNLGAGNVVIGKVGIDQTTPGATNLVESRADARRNAGALHRSGITAADKLAVPGALTVTAVTEAGSTLSNALRNVAVAAYNRWGVTTVSTGSVTPTLNQAVRIAFAAVTGADGYDIFLSTDANPKWVGRITEAQRQAGGIFSSVGVYQAGGAANSIDVGIDGTGVASNANPFASNNAYTPATPAAVNCAGYSVAHVMVKLAVTDLRSLPTLSVVPFLANQQSAGDWHQGALQTVSLLTAVGQSLLQDFRIILDGSTGLVILVDAITGQVAAASVWVELS